MTLIGSGVAPWRLGHELTGAAAEGIRFGLVLWKALLFLLVIPGSYILIGFEILAHMGSGLKGIVD